MQVKNYNPTKHFNLEFCGKIINGDFINETKINSIKNKFSCLVNCY